MSQNKTASKEYRYVENCDIRSSDAEKPMLIGHAAVFDTAIQVYGKYGWKETVKPGAFTKTIKEADIRSLFNHDSNIVLGRRQSGTLRLKEDEIGLYTETDINLDDPDGKKVYEKVKRGDVSQMSFAFKAINEKWNEDYTERELIEVKLFDISPVTYPAYPTTDLSARSEFMEKGINIEALNGLMYRIDNGAELNSEEIEFIMTSVEALRNLIPAKPDNTHVDKTPGNVHSVKIDTFPFYKKLDLRMKNQRKG